MPPIADDPSDRLLLFREIATEGLQNLQQKFGICRRNPVSSKVAHKLRKVSAQPAQVYRRKSLQYVRLPVPVRFLS